ncbi:hypothetical protein [Nonomuraea sp. NPDC048901]
MPYLEVMRTRVPGRHQINARYDVCCALPTQGIAPAALTPEALPRRARP